MAVHAHPDDETIGTGGVLARYGSEGVRTIVVTCTGGELGEVSDPHLASPETLGAVRQRELAAALRVLGVSRSVQLGYRDSGMAGTPDNHHPASFLQAPFSEATAKLVALIREERPGVLVTYDEVGGYGHPDHIQAHRVTVAAWSAAADPTLFLEAGAPWAAPKLYFLLFPIGVAQRFAAAFRSAGIAAPASALAGANAGAEAPAFGAPDTRVTTAIDVRDYADVKRRALTMHRTQMGEDHFLMQLPPPTLFDLWSHEHFERAAGPASSPADLEEDLFAGL